jgi:hypothetical protein
MKKISVKEWISIILSGIGFAITVLIISYLIYPDMTSEKGWWILGFSLFIIELIGSYLDKLYEYKKALADFFNRVFFHKKKK